MKQALTETPRPPRLPPASALLDISLLAMELLRQCPCAIWRLPVRFYGLRYASVNLAVGLMFVFGAYASVSNRGPLLTDLVFAGGALTMAVFVVLRSPPSARSLSPGAVGAFLGMGILPVLLDTAWPRTGVWYWAAATFELLGVALSTTGRIAMGRAFGILPANRGIVSSGPFRWIRHPIYAGWLILMAGYAMSYSGSRNTLIAAMAVPLAVWRIALEEKLLVADPGYQRYRDHVRFRLLPGLY